MESLSTIEAGYLNPAPVAGRTSRLGQSWDLVLPLAVLVVILGSCVLGPAIGGLAGPNQGSLDLASAGIGTSGHLLGTDQLGNDMLSRLFYGGRVTFEVSFASVALGLGLGSAIGMVAGYAGGIVDEIAMRLFDILLAFPALVLALAVAAALGPNERDEIFAIAFFTVPAFGRLARAGALGMRGSEFLLIAKLSGVGWTARVIGHVWPNIRRSLFSYAVAMVGVAIVIASALSFLGLGVRPPNPSWGNMIAAGVQYLSTAPHIAVEPGLFLVATVLAVNVLGDALQERFGQ